MYHEMLNEHKYEFFFFHIMKEEKSFKMKKVLSRSAVDPLFATSESVFLTNDWSNEGI